VHVSLPLSLSNKKLMHIYIQTHTYTNTNAQTQTQTDTDSHSHSHTDTHLSKQVGDSQGQQSLSHFTTAFLLPCCTDTHLSKQVRDKQGQVTFKTLLLPFPVAQFALPILIACMHCLGKRYLNFLIKKGRRPLNDLILLRASVGSNNVSRKVDVR
jgi:hypothetical protein